MSTMYKQTPHRFVAVLNKKCETGRLFNVLGHMAAGLTGLYADRLTELNFTEYTDADGVVHPNISDNPFIVLKADNGNKIRTLIGKLNELGIKHTNFTHTMIHGSAEEQHEETKNTKEVDLEYYGVCFFAESDTAKELTKKFSLFV